MHSFDEVLRSIFYMLQQRESVIEPRYRMNYSCVTWVLSMNGWFTPVFMQLDGYDVEGRLVRFRNDTMQRYYKTQWTLGGQSLYPFELTAMFEEVDTEMLKDVIECSEIARIHPEENKMKKHLRRFPKGVQSGINNWSTKAHKYYNALRPSSKL